MSWIDIGKLVLKFVWPKVLPKLQEMVEDSESPWDDRALTAVTYLINKFVFETKDDCDCPETKPEEEDNDIIDRVLGEKLQSDYI